jgi:Ca2+-binding EF-hand superfamily protein
MKAVRRLARERREASPKVQIPRETDTPSLGGSEDSDHDEAAQSFHGRRASDHVLPVVGRRDSRAGGVDMFNMQRRRSSHHAMLPHDMQRRRSSHQNSGLSAQSPGSRRRNSVMTEAMNVMRQKAFQDCAIAYQEKELGLLQHAFDTQDADKSKTLDMAELRNCLVFIGLGGKNEPERQEIRDILWSLDQLQFRFEDFSNVIVPKVRETLFSLRKPWFAEFFTNIDSYGRRYLSIDDTLNAFRRLGTQVSADVRDDVVRGFMYQENAELLHGGTSDPCLDVDAFARFVWILQEHTERDKHDQFKNIVQMYSISRELQVQFQHDLVDLYAQFHEWEPVSGKYGASSGMLSEHQAITVFRECGYMPKTKLRQDKVVTMVKELKGSDGTLAFPEFLTIIHRLREQDRERLHRILESRSNWAQGMLTLTDIHDALPECGLIPRTNGERAEVKSLLQEFDVEGQNLLSREESVMAIQQLARKFRLIQHEQERRYVISAGWTEGHFAEFRQAFWNFDEDMSEVLECDELVKAVELLRGSYWQSCANMNMLLVALGIDPSKEIQVNFLMFLRMLKMLDESESRRQQGAALGFSQDRTDSLHSLFQTLEPESDGTVSRALFEQLLTGTSSGISKIQHDDLIRMVKQEQLQVEFNSFLRIMKVLDGFLEQMDEGIDDVIADMQQWADRNNASADRTMSAPLSP